MSLHCITYLIDAESRIRQLDDNWQVFAEQNQAPQLTAESLIGRLLEDFITDPKTRHIYALLIEGARSRQASIAIPFRCDAPDRRRFMEMQISALPDQTIRFKSCITREEPRDPVRLLATDVDHSDDFLTICSWCKQVKLAQDHWVEVEEAVEKLDLFNAVKLPHLSHGMCPACLQRMTAEFAD